MEHADITIIGGGAVGLAISAELSRHCKNLVLLERHFSFGQETSSRNSEVIHSSIYYYKGYLKGKLCLEGNEILYNLCAKHNIPYKKTGKLIVAVNDEEVAKMPELFETAKNNGAKNISILKGKEINKIESNITAKQALYAPESGIVDSHRLMQFYEATAINNGCNIVYNSEVKSITKVSDGYVLGISTSNSEIYEFHTKILINSAGLESGNIAALVGMDIDKLGYRIKYLKGIYYRVTKQLEKYPKALVYPFPPQPSVGVHTCPDLAGGMRLGPHFVWVDEIDYSIDDTFHQYFYDFVKSYLPFLEYDDIRPDSTGIMPRIDGFGVPNKDFVIKEESDNGFPNLINLIGIESPGLTSSAAIAKMVKTIINC